MFSELLSLAHVGWLVAAILLGVVLVLVYVNVRAQRLHRALGAFSASLQMGEDGPWVPGVGQYGASSLLWYKLLSLSPAPVLAVSRYDVELSPCRPHPADDALIEVTISVKDASWNIAMDPLTYNGLVSWVESGAPHSTRF